MPGQRQKPRDMLADDRPSRRGQGIIELAAIPEDAELPAPPDGLGTTGLRWWDLFWRSPNSRILQPVDVPSVERLAFIYDEIERLEADLANQTATMGRAKALAKTVQMLRLRIHEREELESRFGISPLARMRLGIVLGQADRALDEMHARYQKPKQPEWVTIDDD